MGNCTCQFLQSARQRRAGDDDDVGRLVDDLCRRAVEVGRNMAGNRKVAAGDPTEFPYGLLENRDVGLCFRIAHWLWR